MIITCPRCSAQYSVNAPSDSMPAAVVRCSNCGHSWTLAPADAPAAPPPPPPPTAATAPESHSQPESAPAEPPQPPSPAGRLKEAASADARQANRLKEPTPQSEGRADLLKEPTPAADDAAPVPPKADTPEADTPDADTPEADTDASRKPEPAETADANDATRVASEHTESPPDDTSGDASLADAPPPAPAADTHEDKTADTPAPPPLVARPVGPAGRRARPTSEPRGGGAWTAVAVGLSLLVIAAGALVLARDPVVSALPEAAPIYAAVGLAVGPTGAGLDFRDVVVEPKKTEDGEVYTVEGIIANLADATRTVPPIRLVFRDADDAEITSSVITPERPHLDPGEVQAFSAVVAQPEPPATRLTVTFARPGDE